MADLPHLTDDQWNELLERLTYYALSKFRKYGWRRGNPQKVEWAGPDGTSPEDLALAAVTSVVEGRRAYDSDTYPDFREFLRSVIDSQISHLAEKARSRRTDRIPIARDGETGELAEVDICGDEPDPADTCMNRELLDSVRGVFAARIEEDPLLVQILQCMEAEITKPAEVAAVLGTDVKSIYNAQKRFQRMIDQAFPEERERQS